MLEDLHWERSKRWISNGKRRSSRLWSQKSVRTAHDVTGLSSRSLAKLRFHSRRSKESLGLAPLLHCQSFWYRVKIAGSLFNTRDVCLASRVTVMPNSGEGQRYTPATAELLERERMTLEAGLLGKFFGSATNAPIYIAGIVVFLFAITCVIVLFVNTNVPAADFLNIIVPVITLALGYLFGKST
jgi:hypothetical protein